MRREMIIKKGLLLLCWGVSMMYAYGQEVLFSTLNDARRPIPLAPNLSTISNTREFIIMDDFELLKKSQITRFNFVGQLGRTTPENLKFIKGVRLFIRRGFNTLEPLSETSCLSYFNLLQEYYSGLEITQKEDSVSISVDLKPLGVDLILEAGTYGIAFAPIIDVDDMPSDKAWYWFQGADSGADTVLWEGTGWVLLGPGSVAFSIEGKKVTLGMPESDTQTLTTTVCPNPSHNIFKINTPKTIASIVVYNGNGQLILQHTSETVDLSAAPRGVYWLTVTHNDGTQVRKKLIKT